jgi:hypothetical protein
MTSHTINISNTSSLQIKVAYTWLGKTKMFITNMIFSHTQAYAMYVTNSNMTAIQEVRLDKAICIMLVLFSVMYVSQTTEHLFRLRKNKTLCSDGRSSYCKHLSCFQQPLHIRSSV